MLVKITFMIQEYEKYSSAIKLSLTCKNSSHEFSHDDEFLGNIKTITLSSTESLRKLLPKK